MENKTIQLAVSLTQDEFIRVKLFSRWKNLAILYVCMFILSLLYFSMASHLLFSWPVSFLIGFAITIPLLILIFFRTIGLFKKDYKKNLSNKEETIYEIGEKGIRISQTEGFFLLTWENVDYVKELDDFFVIWNSGTANAIPKRCFSSLEDISFFKTCFNKNRSTNSSIEH